MTGRSVSRRVLALWCVVIVVVASVSGAAVTASYLFDREQAAVTVSAATDFTVDVGDVTFTPARIEADSEGVFKARVTAPNRSDVDTARFTLSALDGTQSVKATRARCADPGGGWDCTVTFPRQPLVALVGTGEHTLVLRGWWASGRDFEATGTLTVTDSGGSANTTADDGATAGNDAAAVGNEGCVGNTAGAGNDCGGASALVSTTSLPAAAPTSRTAHSRRR